MPRSRTDPNFRRPAVGAHGLWFVNALRHPSVLLTGFPYLRGNRSLCRLPERIVPSLPPLGRWVCRHSSGGALRFRTDSRRIHLRAVFETVETSANTPQNALSGFDLYRREGKEWRFVKTLAGPKGLHLVDDGAATAAPGFHEWLIYFPVRNHVQTLELGVDRGARLRPPGGRRSRYPVLFYGSSIVEGGCASRAGLTYPAIIGRELDVDIINYGFGGSALGEPEVARAIAALKLSALVIDYDHNAPSADHLRATHRRFFEIVRAAQPRLPVLLVSSVNIRNAPAYFGRRAAVIRDTWRRARAAGDRRVWFLHGRDIYPRSGWWDCSCDLTHPNDRGFRLMADAIGRVLRRMLSKG